MNRNATSISILFLFLFITFSILIYLCVLLTNVLSMLQVNMLHIKIKYRLYVRSKYSLYIESAYQQKFKRNNIFSTLAGNILILGEGILPILKEGSMLAGIEPAGARSTSLTLSRFIFFSH